MGKMTPNPMGLPLKAEGSPIDAKGRKILSGLFALVLLSVLASPCSVRGWGWATHAYIEARLAHNEGAGRCFYEGLYGAVAPDAFSIVTLSDSTSAAYLTLQTHKHFLKLETCGRKMGVGSFVFGFLTHNENWGADFTAHRCGVEMNIGYVESKARLLRRTVASWLEGILRDAGIVFPSVLASQVAPDLSHELVEAAVDLLVKRNNWPSVGSELSEAARRRPEEIPEAISCGYGRRVARKMGISFEDAQGMIVQAEAIFRDIIGRYGEILSLGDGEDIRVLAQEGAMLLGTSIGSLVNEEVRVPEEDLVGMLLLAMEMVGEDYMAQLDGTVERMRKRKKLLRYANCGEASADRLGRNLRHQ